MNQDELKAFQAKSYDWEGERLKPDGVQGPKTRWALAIAKLDPRRQAIVARATACVGIREVGTNRGPDIDAWLERCGAPLGSAWCAAFASWCISVAGLPIVKQAGAQALGKSLPPTLSPLPGDLMWFKTGAWQGHVGICIGGDLDHVAAVEGNSANMVRVTRRRRGEVLFSRVVNDFGPAQDAPLPTGLTLVVVEPEGTR